MLRRWIITAAILLPLAAPTSAVALPFLSIGNARHHVEGRFEREEEREAGTDELLNCYRVSSTHVNYYSEEHFTAESCEEFLWRVWETATPHERAHGKFTLNTKGHVWGGCPQGEEEPTG
jgi:hypothetical protein